MHMLAGFAVYRKEEFFTVYLKTYNCVVFSNFQLTKWYSFQPWLLFFKSGEFQRRYSYKIYS